MPRASKRPLPIFCGPPQWVHLKMSWTNAIDASRKRAVQSPSVSQLAAVSRRNLISTSPVEVEQPAVKHPLVCIFLLKSCRGVLSPRKLSSHLSRRAAVPMAMMMSNFDVLFNIAAFLAGLSLLERGAKLFVSSSTTIARRLHLPEILVAILVAGAEWEELAVVLLSLAQRRPALAVGNIIGSCVANIFGAFALGLIFSTGAWEGFDRSSRVACVGLLGLTSIIALFALADIIWNRVVAGLLLAAFGVYGEFLRYSDNSPQGVQAFLRNSAAAQILYNAN